MKKHPDVITMGRSVDCRDILADPVVRFHQKWVKIRNLKIFPWKIKLFHEFRRKSFVTSVLSRYWIVVQKRNVDVAFNVWSYLLIVIYDMNNNSRIKSYDHLFYFVFSFFSQILLAFEGIPMFHLAHCYTHVLLGVGSKNELRYFIWKMGNFASLHLVSEQPSPFVGLKTLQQVSENSF